MTTIDHIAQVLMNLEAAELQNTRLRDANAELRMALERVRQGYRNLLDLRIQQYDGRAHLTREEITEELQWVEAILSPQNVPGHAKPPDSPAERATGHESAGGGVS